MTFLVKPCQKQDHVSFSIKMKMEAEKAKAEKVEKQVFKQFQQKQHKRSTFENYELVFFDTKKF